MSDGRLTEKLRWWEQEPGMRCEDGRRSIDSVVAHLQRILNTRMGNVPIADDFGVPDFLNLLQSYPESVRQIERSIRKAIEKYEPRLKGTRVVFIPQDEHRLTLHFEITAHLADPTEHLVCLETIVDADGKVRVK